MNDDDDDNDDNINNNNNNNNNNNSRNLIFVLFSMLRSLLTSHHVPYFLDLYLQVSSIICEAG